MRPHQVTRPAKVEWGKFMSKTSDHQLERLVFFSDAVFAIAITLLIIEVKVPHLSIGASMAEVSHALLASLPSIAGFVLSFLVNGRFWIGHHSALAATAHHETRLLWPNLFLLMSIAFLPFATAFMSENLSSPFPVIFYNVSLSLTALLSLWVIWLATDTHNAARDVDNLQRKSLRLRGMSAVMGMLLTLLISFFWQGWSQLFLLSIPLFNRLLRRLNGMTA